MPDRKHYQTEEEAIADLWRILGESDDKVLPMPATGYGYTVYHFVAGILTVMVPYGYEENEPRILLRENEGLYWEVPDA